VVFFAVFHKAAEIMIESGVDHRIAAGDRRQQRVRIFQGSVLHFCACRLQREGAGL